MESREAMLPRLAAEPFDLLVIGGGITGAGVARAAALSGLRVALVERRDFGCGTSSRSTKLVHGGLRYLKQFDIRLVREAVVERQRLLAMAPHLVRPMPFLFPVYRGDPDALWKLRIGLTLYDWFAGRRNMQRHRTYDRPGLLALEPGLRAPGLTGGAVYADAVTDDARLTLAALQGALAAGAVAVNYAEVCGFGRGDWGALAGARVRDVLGGGEFTVRCRRVLNATGPWLDQVRRLDDPHAPPVLRPTKGAHVAVPRERLPVRHAVVVFGPDRRLMFTVPAGAFTYLGTTDTDYDGDLAEPPVDRADVDYLLAAANRAFPDRHLTGADVVSAWSGLRPLVDPGDGRRPSDVSRDCAVFRSPSGLVSVGGGKLTTFRSMAARLVDELFPGRRRQGPADLALAPLPGGEQVPDPAEVAAAAARAGAPAALARTLAERHGARFREVLAGYGTAERDMPLRLARLTLEARWAVRTEMARTLADFLVRRTSESLWSADNGRAVAEPLAREMGSLLGWDGERIRAEVAAYLDLVDAMGRWRQAPRQEPGPAAPNGTV